jgi:sporulation protein YlmC with PRC-barrel domain
MSRNLNGARGIIIPHQFVKAIGDVFVINGANLPIAEREEVSEDETMDLSKA